MALWQQIIIVSFGLLNIGFFIKGYYEITKKKNAFGLTNYLLFLGVFVWGDIFVLGPFWMLVSLVTLLLQDWYLFLLIISVFWVVRSFGEVMYWLNEQFSGKNRNLPHTLRFHKIFQSEAVWFIYQLIWQCMLVMSITATLFLAKAWLLSR
jgi:hypothetical protein